jgi:hypothetical protein
MLCTAGTIMIEYHGDDGTQPSRRFERHRIMLLLSRIFIFVSYSLLTYRKED